MQGGLSAHTRFYTLLPCAGLSPQAGGGADDQQPVTPPWERFAGEQPACISH